MSRKPKRATRTFGNHKWLERLYRRSRSRGDTGWPILLKEDQTLTAREIEIGKRIADGVENGDPQLCTLADGRKQYTVPVTVAPAGKPKAQPQNPNYILED